MRKNNVILLIFIVVMLIGVILIMAVQRNSLSIKSFDVSDYQYFIENFSSEENLGNISNAEDAVIKAENVWLKIYGEHVKREKPYQVFYDAENEVWLIQGSLRPNMMGGVSNILIENDTGKVLAVWHDK